MSLITAITAGAASQVAVPARPRKFLGIYNQHATNTLAVAFDTVAVTAATAGQVTVGAAGASVIWSGEGVPPTSAINIIASGASTPVTIIESF